MCNIFEVCMTVLHYKHLDFALDAPYSAVRYICLINHKQHMTSGVTRGCVSDLVVVADEDVDGRQQQLQHRLLVALFHLETEALQEARRTFGTLAAAVLQAPRQ